MTTLWFLGALFQLKAEYRVYQYYVKDRNASAQTPAHFVTSTLDPVSYRAYHGGQTTRADLLRHWMCYGSTAHRRICPPPTEGLKSDKPPPR